MRYGLDDPRHARASLQHAADSTYCPVCGAPYDYAAAYVGHLGDYRCPNGHVARLPLEVAAREIELHGLDGTDFTLVTPEGKTSVRLVLPGLYNVYNAVAAAAIARALGEPLESISAGLTRFTAAFGRFERIDAGNRRLLMLLVKNPAGANEAVRTLLDGPPPRLAVVALNDAIADGRDVSWIWDVDFEPLLAGLERVVVSGERAAELALRFAYGGLERERIEIVPNLESALDRGLELTPEGGELVVLPTYTAMLGLRGIVARQGSRPRVLGEGLDEDPRRASLPRLPQHLCRPREHRRARRACAGARPRAERDADRARRPASRRGRSVLYRRRPGSRAGDRGAGSRCPGGCAAGGGRRGVRVPGRLRRLPAPRTVLP